MDFLLEPSCAYSGTVFGFVWIGDWVSVTCLFGHELYAMTDAADVDVAAGEEWILRCDGVGCKEQYTYAPGWSLSRNDFFSISHYLWTGDANLCLTEWLNYWTKIPLPTLVAEVQW